MTMAIRWLSGITSVLVLLQAVLIGQALYLGDMAKLALHGWLGSGSLAAAVVLTVLTVIAARRGELSSLTPSLGILVMLLMVAQLGLGYVGRRGGWPAAIHIPNGVFIAGLLFTLLMSTFMPKAQAGPIRR